MPCAGRNASGSAAVLVWWMFPEVREARVSAGFWTLDRIADALADQLVVVMKHL